MDRFEEAKLRIKEATDLVALVESYLPLRPRGRDLVALCPFHAERSPSFTVSRTGQFFHCFGCGKNGDAFTWLMEREGLTFREAMEVLAERAGVSLEGVFQTGAPRGPKGPDPYLVLAEVAGFFQRCLGSDEGVLARAYLEQRGLSAAIVPWRLGVHPRPGALGKFVADKKLPREILEHAGLLKNGREPYAYRLMFPIEDERGRVVAFGGRIVPGAPGSDGDGDFKPPKYMNSTESPWFNKRRVLYGLSRAKAAGARKLLVTEGYTDVIACHLAGFHGAVASLGTAFTRDHARLVERYATEGLVLMFDGDRAGRQAAERALRELVNSRLAVRIAMVGDGVPGDGAPGDGAAATGAVLPKDPADLLAERPGDDPELVAVRREAFRELLEHAEDDLSVWFRLLRQRLDLNQAVNVELAARECAGILALCEEPVRRGAMRDAMARHLAMPPDHLQRLLDRLAVSLRGGGSERGGVGERGGANGRRGAGARAPAGGGELAAAEPTPETWSDADLGDGSLAHGGPGASPVGRPAAGSPQVGGRAQPARTVRSVAEKAEIELAACVLAEPAVLADLDLDAEPPFGVVGLRDLLDAAVLGVASGRLTRSELLHFLFARFAELPVVRSLLGEVAARAETIATPRPVLLGLLEGRRRLGAEPVRRSLRQRLQEALAIGDQPLAARLQQELLASLRRELPRGEPRPGRPRSTASAADQAPADASSGPGPDGDP